MKSLTVLEYALELLPSFKALFPIPIFKIVCETTLVNLATFPNQHSITRTRTSLKMTLISVAIDPNILPFAVRLPLGILSIVFVPIGELLASFTMFQEVLELSPILGSTIMNVGP